MCMIDDCCRAELWSESRAKARKEHRCGECGRTIKRGETYCKVFGVQDGDPFAGKWCAHCNVAKNWLWTNCGGSLLGAVIEDCESHVQEYGRLADCIPALARICVGARRKWTVRRGPSIGQLMPIPEQPAKLEPRRRVTQ